MKSLTLLNVETKTTTPCGVPVCVCVQLNAAWLVEPVEPVWLSEAALWATAMVLPPLQLSGQGQDASSVPGDREGFTVQQIHS